MKYFGPDMGIAPWKIDSPIERWLSYKADNSFFWKKLYVKYYKLFDSEYYKGGLQMISKLLDKMNVDEDLNRVKLTVWGVVNSSLSTDNKLVVDMIYSLHRFGCMFDEYFLYNFPALNTKGRESFITEKISRQYFWKFNLKENIELFDNKYKTYQLFKQFYHREVCVVENDGDRFAMDAFAQKHKTFFCKPVGSSGGRGAKVIKEDQYDFDKLLSAYKKGFLAEELVKNNEEIRQINESSLNTVRISTVLKDEGTDIAFCFIRFGRAGMEMDNGFMGGIICSIDKKTGIITNTADENNNRFLIHPDSGMQLVGFMIPKWSEAIDMAKELATVVPTNRYMAWDLALTDNGWVMIEGNCKGQFVGPQCTERKGVKTMIENYLKHIKEYK